MGLSGARQARVSRRAGFWAGLAAAALIALGACSAPPAASAVPAKAGFDARRPADVLSVLTAKGAPGEIRADEHGLPLIDDKAGFEVDFHDCDGAGRLCATEIYVAGWSTGALRLAQINGWNRRTPACPANLTPEGHPHMTHFVTPSARDTPEVVTGQLAVWAGCLDAFHSFMGDPEGYLKRDAG